MLGFVQAAIPLGKIAGGYYDAMKGWWVPSLGLRRKRLDHRIDIQLLQIRVVLSGTDKHDRLPGTVHHRQCCADLHCNHAHKEKIATTY